MRNRSTNPCSGEPFAEKYPRLLVELDECFVQGERFMGVVRGRLGSVSE